MKTLSIHIQDDSIGFILVDDCDGKAKTLKSILVTYDQNVDKEAGGDVPSSRARSLARGVRVNLERHKKRREWVLNYLLEKKLIDGIDCHEMRLWKKKGMFPVNEFTNAFMAIDPYKARLRCVTEKLDMESRDDRLCLARAIYNFTEKRGYRNIGEDAEDDNEAAESRKAISQLHEDMKTRGCEYLCEYFCQLIDEGKKVRGLIADRRDYQKEFLQILKVQEIPFRSAERLYKVLFEQKHPAGGIGASVGKCVLERTKKRTFLSHPDVEEFRFLSFLNNIKVYDKDMTEGRGLTDEEKAIVRKAVGSAAKVDFSKIAERLAVFNGKKYFRAKKESGGWNDTLVLNYRGEQSVPGCPVMKHLSSALGIDIFGDEIVSMWKGRPSTRDSIIDTIFAFLCSNESSETKALWAVKYLGLDEKAAGKFAKIKPESGRAAYSMRAIRRILPFLRKGCNLYKSTLFAKIPDILGKDYWFGNENCFTDELMEIMNGGDKNSVIFDSVRQWLLEKDLPAGRADMLYCANSNMFAAEMKDGKMLLPVANQNDIRNPIVLRVLSIIRKTVNKMIRNGDIDKNSSKVVLLVDDCIRSRIARNASIAMNKAREKAQDNARNVISQHYATLFGKNNRFASPGNVTKNMVLKYILWEEQGKKDLITGEDIPMEKLFNMDSHSIYNIDHIIPYSKCSQSHKANMCLVTREFNMRKGSDLLSSLPEFEQMKDGPVFKGYLKKVAAAQKEYESLCRRNPSTPEEKDRIVCRKYILMETINYFREKINRLTSASYSVSISNFNCWSGVIVQYLKTVFPVHKTNYDIVEQFLRYYSIGDFQTKRDVIEGRYSMLVAAILATAPVDSKMFIPKNGQVSYPFKNYREWIKATVLGSEACKRNSNNMEKVKRVITKGKKTFKCSVPPVRGQLVKETVYGARKDDNGDMVFTVRDSLANVIANDKVDKIYNPNTRRIVIEKIAELGADAVKEGIQHDNTIMKKVRIIDSVKNPVKVKKHVYLSKKPERQYVYKQVGDTYCLLVLREKGSGANKLIKISKFDYCKIIREYSSFKAYVKKVCKDLSVKGKVWTFRDTIKQGSRILMLAPGETSDDVKKKSFSTKKRTYNANVLSENNFIARADWLKGPVGGFDKATAKAFDPKSPEHQYRVSAKLLNNMVLEREFSKVLRDKLNV